MTKQPNSSTSSGDKPKPNQKPTKPPTGNVGTRDGSGGKTIKK